MTGVHQRFAVAKGNVIIPEHFDVSVSSNQWTVFNATEDIRVAVYQAEDFGLIAVFPETDSLTNLEQVLAETNPNPEKTSEFIWPDNIGPSEIERVKFNIHASNRNPVIVSVNDGPVRRAGRDDWQQWPLIYIEDVDVMPEGS